MSLKWPTSPTLLCSLCLLLTVLKTLRIPFYSLKTPGMSLPQGFCTWCSLWLESSFPRKIACLSPSTLAYHCKNIAFSERPHLLTLHTPTFMSLPLHALSFSRTIWYRMTHNIFFSYFISLPMRVQALQNSIFVLISHVASASRQHPGTQ